MLPNFAAQWRRCGLMAEFAFNEAGAKSDDTGSILSACSQTAAHRAIKPMAVQPSARSHGSVCGKQVRRLVLALRVGGSDGLATTIAVLPPHSSSHME